MLSPAAVEVVPALLLPEPQPLFATHMFAPSNASPPGQEPTANVPSKLPLLCCSLVTLSPCEFATQMAVPSKAPAVGRFPTAKVPMVDPSLARSSVNVLSLELATHMFAPSNASPYGPEPTVNVPNTTPSLARSLVTLLLRLCRWRARLPVAEQLGIKDIEVFSVLHVAGSDECHAAVGVIHGVVGNLIVTGTHSLEHSLRQVL